MPYRNALVLFVLLFRALPVAAEETVAVTMLQLEGMVTQQRWSEALFRVDEIAVGQRDEKWRRLVTRVVVGHLSQLASENSPGRDGIALELGRRYPFLGRSEDYRRRRDDAIVIGYRDCVELQAKEKENDCTERLSERLTEAGDDTALVVRGAKEVTQLENEKKAAEFVRLKVGRAPSSIKSRLESAPELKALLK